VCAPGNHTIFGFSLFLPMGSYSLSLEAHLEQRDRPALFFSICTTEVTFTLPCARSTTRASNPIVKPDHVSHKQQPIAVVSDCALFSRSSCSCDSSPFIYCHVHASKKFKVLESLSSRNGFVSSWL
jgi:hypothetical protein